MAKRAGRWRRRLAAALVLLLVAIGLGSWGAWSWLRQEYSEPGPATAALRIEVPQGASVHGVLARLQSEGALRDARAVQWYLRLTGAHPRVQAGRYEIPPRASPAQIIEMFDEGKVLLEQLTVVEGSTFADFVQLLEDDRDVGHTLVGRSPADIMKALGHPGESPEGRFFPDTYRFAAGTSDTSILTMAYSRMHDALTAAWSARAPHLPLDTPYQALILASLIEKEAALKSERARIAGVFVNRLRKGMRLQSDPTVIYGLGARYDGEIHTRDLLADSAYNTYTRSGLPPTPIALPGRESLLAAVHPEDTQALYFVATGLGDGAHHFSSTLEEHNSAVKAYLTRMRHAARPARARADAAATPAATGSHP